MDEYKYSHYIKIFILLYVSLQDPDQVGSLIGVSLQLASSRSPPDCITAAYLLRVLVKFHQTGVVLAAMQGVKSIGQKAFFYEAFYINDGDLGEKVKPSKHNYSKLNRNRGWSTYQFKI